MGIKGLNLLTTGIIRRKPPAKLLGESCITAVEARYNAANLLDSVPGT